MAEWIWLENQKRDVHAEFTCAFDCNEDISNVILRLSCDGNYAIFLNDTFVGLGQMSDFETYKLRDEYDVSQAIARGKNVLKILVWHIGVDSVNYRAERAGVWFEVLAGEEVWACSDERTLSRTLNRYAQEYCRMIAQVGITSLYDFTAEDAAWTESVLSPKKVDFAKENVKNLTILPDVYGKVLKQEKNRVLVDLGREYYGLLRFTVTSKAENNQFTVYFGEHLLESGTVLRNIATCHFGLDFIAKSGENRYADYFRPIGCRYLELLAEEEIEVVSLGIAPMEYPFQRANHGLDLKNRLDKDIYETCVQTLRCCANKHYIDCPWREQGMYVLDSRNQMLCGYDAFEEYALPRFNLKFLSKGLTKYGLLCSCPPSAQDNFIIPFFSLVYVLQIYEYVERTGDRSIVAEVGDALAVIMRTFLDRIDENGLIKRFSPTHFWNFYEWTRGSDGCSCNEGDERTYDVILNCAFVMAAEKYALLAETVGKRFSFDLDVYRARIKSAFYDEEKGLFRLNTRTREYSQLGCAVALLAEVVTGEEAQRVAGNMLGDGEIVECSLSCASFFYDALLKVNDGYKDYVLKDIRKKYEYMLGKGATTFWETLNGSAENGGIGSLCHGWSALPIYYYHKFFS